MTELVDFFDMLGQTEWNRSLQRTLIHWIGVHDSQRVLDVGCGAGRFTSQLAQRAEWVTGIDISDHMVFRAQQIAADFSLDNTTFVVGDVADLPFPNQSFDLVTCVNVLFLVQNPRKVLSELLRVTNTSGQVVVLEPGAAMNPWAVQSYCEQHRLKDFEKDSLMSWSSAAARHPLRSVDEYAGFVEPSVGRLEETSDLMDGIAQILKFVPNRA